MAKIHKRGVSGAAKNYVTRSSALRKLQLSLSDFRRLCILKGIFPRVPRHAKRANKGSSAPTTFYYAKDIAYLAHEPVLAKLRAHKTFAKRLSRAIARQEWAAAKGLEESKPTYALDHIIKERYPTFADALRDIDDALSLIVLFARLPAAGVQPGANLVKPELIQNCQRLVMEWDSYVARTHALRKAFFSIKGTYFQAEVRGETVTWLVPYMFTQHVPTDVDFRILATFLELYQTLVGFVLFRLYTDENLVYPPKIDEVARDAGAEEEALQLEGAKLASAAAVEAAEGSGAEASGARKLTAKEVKKQIRAITASGEQMEDAEDEEEVEDAIAGGDTEADAQKDEFVEQPSKSAAAAPEEAQAPLISLASLSSASSASTSLFSPYTFYLDRSTPTTLLRFMLLSFGARPAALSSDTTPTPAFDLSDSRITHHIVDRPQLPASLERYRGSRVFIQPQWVADSINAGRILPAGPYEIGQALPPHLSPFVDEERTRREGGYVPLQARTEAERDGAAAEAEEDDDESMDEEDPDVEEEEEQDEEEQAARPARAALLSDPSDPTGELLSAAELEAEAAGGEEALVALSAAHAKALKAVPTKGPDGKKKRTAAEAEADEDASTRALARSLLSNKQRKILDRVTHSRGVKAGEKEKLEKRRIDEIKAAKRKGGAGAAGGAKAKKAGAAKKGAKA